MECQCLNCKYNRKEITKEQYTFGMQNRLEVWQIIKSYMPQKYGDVKSLTEENLHMLEMNVDSAIMEIEELLNCL